MIHSEATYRIPQGHPSDTCRNAYVHVTLFGFVPGCDVGLESRCSDAGCKVPRCTELSVSRGRPMAEDEKAQKALRRFTGLGSVANCSSRGHTLCLGFRAQTPLG